MSQFVQGPWDPILKPRDMGQLLDQSFKIFGRAWKQLITIGLVAAVPGVLMGLAMSSMMPSLNSTDPMNNWIVRIFANADRGDFSGLISLLSIAGILGLAMLLLMPLYQGALIDASARAVLQMEPVPFAESFRVAARRYWALLGTALLKGLIWIIALPLFVIGGLVVLFFISVPLGSAALLVVTVFSSHAIIIEGKSGGMPALKRAWELGKSRFWPLMGIGIVFSLLTSVIQGILVTPFSLGGVIAAAATQSTAMIGLPYIMQGLVSAVTVPFLSVALTLVYFDTRIRREGYDLEMMARQGAQQGSQEPQPAVAPPPDPRL